MKCLTVCQPWVHAIFYCGKDFENRNYITTYRGPLLIHAGLSKNWYVWESQNPSHWLRTTGQPLPEWSGLPRGVIVGMVTLLGCFDPWEVASKWASGPWCWKLGNPVLFDEPIPTRGTLGIFEVPDETIPEKYRV
jgi:hypothetical protein